MPVTAPIVALIPERAAVSADRVAAGWTAADWESLWRGGHGDA